MLRQLVTCVSFAAIVFATASVAYGVEKRYDYTPLLYNNPDARPFIKVGLQASLVAFDHDGDGDDDIILCCGGMKKWFGTWLFENPSAPGAKDPFPVFKTARKVAGGKRGVFAKTYPDGRIAVTHRMAHTCDFRKTGWSDWRKFSGRWLCDRLGHVKIDGNVWTLADYDGDGRDDLIVGLGDREAYGWDDAYTCHGVWTNGAFKGMMYFVRNEAGADGAEKWGRPEPILLENSLPAEVCGNPVPMLHDWDGDGDLDMIVGDFLDGFTYFENVGTRTRPRWAAGRFLRDSAGGRLCGDLCVMTPAMIDWDRDGKMDFLSSEEDGRAAFYRNTGRIVSGMPVFDPPVYLRGEADRVHFGILVTPAGVDWDGDGDLDIITGNSAGYIGFIENLSGPGGGPPKWAEPKLLSCRPFDPSRGAPSLGGMVSYAPIRIMAGYNGSIQGPAEGKWGYTCLSVADWNGDGLPDIMVNSIWGKPLVFLNVGTRTRPELAAPQGVEVEWNGAQPELAWGWYKPSVTDNPKELITQWRTTPVMFDMNRDGLMDLIMLDHEGYLAFFERARRADGTLFLKHPRRAFTVGPKRSLLRPSNRRAGGSGRRKIAIGDWNGDGKADIVMNSRNSYIYRQVGEKDGTWHFEPGGEMAEEDLSGHSTSPAFVDFDSDGIPEILLGCEDGFYYHLRNSDWRKVEGANRALVPVAPFEKTQYDWTNRHARILREQRTMDPEIVLLGDSITHEWAGRHSIGGADAFPRFKRAFEGYRVMDAGYGFDRIQNILWRLDNGELDGIRPKLVVLLAGTNNMNMKSKADPTLVNSTPAEIAEGVLAIVDRLRRKLPESHLLVLGIFPRGRKAGSRCRVEGAAANARIAAGLKGMERVSFADISNVFLDDDGVFPEALSHDALHLKDAGFDRWRSALQPWIQKYVAPSAMSSPRTGSERKE